MTLREKTIIDIDASLVGLGGVVYQLSEDGKKVVIQYLSKKFNKTQTRWSPYLREAYGLYYTCVQCKELIDACDKVVKIITDQLSLKWVLAARNPMVMRWVVETIQHLNIEIEWRAGILNLVADALSRIPCITRGAPTK